MRGHPARAPSTPSTDRACSTALVRRLARRSRSRPSSARRPGTATSPTGSAVPAAGPGVRGRLDSATAYFWHERSWGGPLAGSCAPRRIDHRGGGGDGGGHGDGNGHGKKDRPPEPVAPGPSPAPTPAPTPPRGGWRSSDSAVAPDLSRRCNPPASADATASQSEAVVHSGCRERRGQAACRPCATPRIPAQIVTRRRDRTTPDRPSARMIRARATVCGAMATILDADDVALAAFLADAGRILGSLARQRGDAATRSPT